MARHLYLRKPGPFLVLTVLIALTVLITMSVTFWLSTGITDTPFIASEEVADLAGKDEAIMLLKNAAHQLKNEAASAQHSAKSGLAAVEEMKKSLREKELELLQLNQELHFYRTLYSSNTDNTALQVKEFVLRKGPVTGQFVYSLVLTSIPAAQKKTSGVIGLSVEGKQQGIPKQLAFEDIGEITDTSLKFSFKYFQKISGSFSLPDNFEPQQVQVKLLQDSSKEKPVNISYNWDKVYNKVGM